jgi:hypothetical protein
MAISVLGRPLSAEVASAAFGDARLSKRLTRIVDQLSAAPGDSFPHAFCDDGQLEGGYRFFRNRKVTAQAIVEPHIQASIERAAQADCVRVLHDRSEFAPTDGVKREGFGPFRGKGNGFFGHFALVVSADDERQPFGVVGMHLFSRAIRPKGEHKETTAENVESRCWGEIVDDVERRLAGRARAVHIMDRQADSYELMAQLGDRGFVIRAFQDRTIALPDDERGKLFDVAERSKALFRRQVPLSRRHKPREPWTVRQHPPREARNATLSISARTVTLRRPSNARVDTPFLTINVVRVWESKPPPDAEPVEWLLLTNLPVENDEQVATIVDHYRARWLIEEFFKALKTGCRVEHRQLETAHGFQNALATFVPIAWRLLLLRHTARHAPDRSASAILPQSQIAVLARLKRARLPRRPTVRDAMLAIARLGGHLASNGDPGWQVLARGYDDLLLLEEGWSARECDQS